MKMRLNKRKQALDEELKVYMELGLKFGFVPLCASEMALTIKCPMCGLIMVPIVHDEYLCPECGIFG